jgi:hypothetical protein
VKILGSTIGAARSVEPSDFDGDGDGFLTGPDGRDNIPAPKKIESLVQRDGSVMKFFRLPNPNSPDSEQINVVNDKGDVVQQLWVWKNAPEWKERQPIAHADAVLKHLDNLEEKYSKVFGDLREPKNMRKAIAAKFPNLIDAGELNDLYPARNEDGSVNVRDIDVGRVALLLHAADSDPEISKKISIVGVSGKLTGGLFGGTYPGVFVYGVGKDKDNPFFAGLDFNPNYEQPAFTKDHGWGLKVLSDMKDAGYSKKDIDAFYGAYLAAHEFGHAKHILRSLDKVGVDINAKSEDELIDNLKKMAKEVPMYAYLVDDFESRIAGKIAITSWKDEQSDAERRRLSIIALLQEVESSFMLKHTDNNNPALWDSLTDAEREKMSSREQWNKVSGYASQNALEFVAETVAQDLMEYKDGHTPDGWGKMADWLNVKADNSHKVVTKKASGIHPKVDGVITALCTGFPEGKKKKEIKRLIIR